MRTLSSFRGACGEVVDGFLSLGTLFTLGPVLVAATVLLAFAGLLVHWLELPPWLALPTLVVLTSPLTGLFAVAARAGDLDAGFLDALTQHRHAVPAWVLRHGLLTFAWTVPVGLGFGAVAGRLQAALGGLVLGGAGGGTVIGAALALAGLLLASVTLPTLVLLVATRADGLADCFSRDAWTWVLVERRRDAWVMLAAMIGAMTLFVLLLLPLGAVLALALATASPEIGATVGVLAYVSPALAGTILAGRMAGAFALADFVEAPGALPSRAPEAPFVPPSELRVEPRPAPASAAPERAAVVAPARPPSAAPVQAGATQPALGVQLARLRERAASEPEAAATELGTLAAAHPRNPAVRLELALALRQAGDLERACREAGESIALSLALGTAPLARETFAAFRSEADRLGLDARGHDQVARLLLAGGDFAGAAWNHRAAAALGGDALAAQKGLVAAAERAAKAGEVAEAAAIYEALVQEFPDTAVTQHARDALAALHRKGGSP